MQMQGKKNKKIRYTNRNSIRIIVVVFILVHLTFFATGFIPDQSKYTVSAFRTPQKLSEYKEISLIRWEWASAEKTMEVEFDITDTTYSEGSVVVSCLYDNTKPLDCQIVYSSESTIIIQIYGMPAVNSKAVKVKFEYAPPDEEVCQVTFTSYTGVIDLADTLPVLDEKSYFNNRINYDVAYYQKLIDEQNVLIEKNQKQIAEVKEEINRLNTQPSELTTDELLHLNERLQNNEDMIRYLENAIEDSRQVIFGYQDTIRILEKRRLP